MIKFIVLNVISIEYLKTLKYHILLINYLLYLSFVMISVAVKMKNI